MQCDAARFSGRSSGPLRFGGALLAWIGPCCGENQRLFVAKK
jgi:hypothetical protein